MIKQVYTLSLWLAFFCSSFCKNDGKEVGANGDTRTNDKVFTIIGIPGLNMTDISLDQRQKINLFKLNTDPLFTDDPLSGEDGGPDSNSGWRESRKINFLKGVWGGKPKISPLYLINGTVCRFINAAPICTTLTTTGLLPTSNSTPPTGGQFSGGGEQPVQFASNQFTNQLQQNQGFVNQQQGQEQQRQQQQQPRPSAILDDDSQDINVESSSFNGSTYTNVTESPTFNVRQQQPQLISRPMTNIQPATMRPQGVVYNRRPMNILSFRRPLRQFVALRGRTDEDKLDTRYMTKGGRAFV